MPTLIRVKDKSGKMLRCDERCYNAKSTKCVCICGGKNHGVGLIQALSNTVELAAAGLEKLYEEYLEDKNKGLNKRQG